jgi:hypothetical protein
MKIISFFLLAIPVLLSGLEKLDSAYLISYGNPNAPIKLVHYFSFTCPTCVSLFRDEWDEIKDTLIDTGKVHWTFHPVPADLLTVQGMECLQHLSEREKKIFFEALFAEMHVESPELSALLMEKGMELFKKPIPGLRDRSYLEKTDAFMSAFNFLKQTEKIIAVPTAEINGKMYPKEMPDREFLNRKLKASA